MKFSELKLIEPLQRSLKNEGYAGPTPIQEQSIPPILLGKDLLGIAQTGTGKTAAFVLPLLQRLSRKKKRIPKSPRALILAPTRELAAQIGVSIATYGYFLEVKHTVIFGGVGQGPQVNAIRKGGYSCRHPWEASRFVERFVEPTSCSYQQRRIFCS